MSLIRNKVHEILRNQEIPVNPNLPDLEKELKIFKTPQDIALRIIHLYSLIGITMPKVEIEKIKKWLEVEGVFDSLENEEKRIFIETPQSNKLKKNLSWLKESLYTLIWAIKGVSELPFPNILCNLDSIFNKIPPKVPVNQFMKETNIRNKEEILFQTDLHYNLHWALKESKLSGNDKGLLLKINGDIVIERRKALEWIVSKSLWNEIVLDT